MKLIPPNITPGPWALFPVARTFKIGTFEMDSFVSKTHYMAGEPFVCELNDDFNGPEAHSAKSSYYHKLSDDDKLKANAQFIAAAPAMAAALEKAHLYMLNLPESDHDESREAYLAVTAALMAAGYRLE